MRKAAAVLGEYTVQDLHALVQKEANSASKNAGGSFSAFLIALIYSDIALVIWNHRSLFSVAHEQLTPYWNAGGWLPWIWLAVQATLLAFAVNSLRSSVWSVAAGRYLREVRASLTPSKWRTPEQKAMASSRAGLFWVLQFTGLLFVSCLIAYNFASAMAAKVPIELAFFDHATLVCALLVGLPIGLVIAITVVCLSQDRSVAIGFTAGCVACIVVLMLAPPSGSSTTVPGDQVGSQVLQPTVLTGQSQKNYRIISWLMCAVSALSLGGSVVGRGSAPRRAVIKGTTRAERCIKFPPFARRALMAPIMAELDQQAFPQSVLVIYRGDEAHLSSGVDPVPFTEAECEVLRLDQLQASTGKSISVSSAEGLFEAQIAISVTPWTSRSESRKLRVPSDLARAFVEQLFVNPPSETFTKAVQASVDRFVLNARGPSNKSSTQLLADIDAAYSEAQRQIASGTVTSADFSDETPRPRHQSEILNRRKRGESQRLKLFSTVLADFESRIGQHSRQWRDIKEQQERAIGSGFNFEADLQNYLATEGRFDLQAEASSIEGVRQLLQLCGIAVRTTKLTFAPGVAEKAESALTSRRDEFVSGLRERILNAEAKIQEIDNQFLAAVENDQAREDGIRTKVLDAAGPALMTAMSQPGGFEAVSRTVGLVDQSEIRPKLPETPTVNETIRSRPANSEPKDPDGGAP